MINTSSFPPDNPKGHARFRWLYLLLAVAGLLNLVVHAVLMMTAEDNSALISLVVSIRIMVLIGAPLLVVAVLLDLFRHLRGAGRPLAAVEGQQKPSVLLGGSFLFLLAGWGFSFSDAMMLKAAGDGKLGLMLFLCRFPVACGHCRAAATDI